MGVKTFESGGGYVKFDKNANIYINLDKMEPGWNDKQDRPQLTGTAQAVSIEDETMGTVPYYFTSKITILEDDQYSSNLGIILRDTDVLRDVLAEISVSEENIEKIVDPSTNMLYEAETEGENAALYEAILEHFDADDAVWKASTVFNKGEDYSKIKKVIKQVEKDPFPDEDNDDESESGDEPESADDDDDVSEEDLEEASTSADVEEQSALA